MGTSGSNNLNLIQAIETNQYMVSITQSLDFDQEIVTNQHMVSIDQTFDLVQTHWTNQHMVSIDQALGLDQNDKDTYRLKGILETLQLSDEAHRAYIETLVATVKFTQLVAQVHYGVHTLSLDDTVTAEIVKTLKDRLTFTQVVSIAGSLLTRAITQSFEFTDYAVAYILSDTGRYGQDDKDASGNCTIVQCSRDHCTFVCGSSSVDLRNPTQTQVLSINIAENYTRSLEPKQSGDFPVFTVLNMQFTGINRKQCDAFKTFFKNSAGFEITYTDACNDSWVGCIITDEIEFEQEGNGYECVEGSGVYAFAFEFEGAKV